MGWPPAALKQSCDGDALQAAIQQVIPELEDGKATVSLDQALLILPRGLWRGWGGWEGMRNGFEHVLKNSKCKNFF